MVFLVWLSGTLAGFVREQTTDSMKNNGCPMVDGAYSNLRAVPRVLWRSHFLRNTTVLMTGTMISQVLLLLASPFLGRLFDPTAFGIYGLYTASLSMLTPVVDLQYGQALVLPKEDSDAGGLFALGTTIVFSVSGLALLVVGVGGRSIAHLLNSAGAANWLWWIPGSLLLVGICAILEFWATRRKRFWSISSRRVARSTSQVGVQLGAGAAKLGGTGLIAGVLLGQLAETLMLAFQVLRKDAGILKASFKLSHMRTLAREYRSFGLYGTPQELMNSISQTVPIFMLASFFGTGVVGLYSMAVRVLQLPVSFITSSLRQVYVQRAAEVCAHGKDAYPLFRKATLGLVALVALPTLVIIILGPWLFNVVLGSDWFQAGVYARWLVLWLACGVVNVPSTAMLLVLRLQRSLLMYDAGLLAARVLAIAILAKLFGAYEAVVGYSLVGLAANAALVLATDRYLRRNRRSRIITEVDNDREDGT